MGAIGILFVLLVPAANPGWPPSDPETSAEALTSTAAMPDDPDYRPRLDAQIGCRGQLGLYSFVPFCAPLITAIERPKGTGVHADRAWLWTIGRPEVRIAFLDDGIDWSDRDLVSRIALNAGELPGHMDTNGDGVLDVRDFAADPRARDANGNGFLDPQDLLMIFRDGVDDDDNGYVDDIAGWDFIDDDPDPGSSTPSRLIADAVAEANNGIAGAGACPGCTAIPLRVSSSGLASGNELGLSIAYAVDRGARLMATSASSAGGSSFVKHALEYAASKDVLLVASAGLSGTPLREGPWENDRALVVGAVGFDHPRVDRATTSFRRDPCSGYGKEVSVSAPGSCDVRAVGITAGALGLVLSTSLGIPGREVPALDPPLSMLELMHVAIATADSGRINARAAVDAVIRRRVPPEAELTSPPQNAVIDPTPATGIAVLGRVNNARSMRASWVLEWAIGRAPEAASFSAIGSGTLGPGEGADVTALVPTLLIFRDPTAPPGSGSRDFEITIRLVTTAVAGGELARAETRRVVSVHRDLELMPAFPIMLGAEAIGSARAIDVDGDGAEDIALALDDGTVHAIDVRGQTIGAFPIALPAWPLLDAHRGAPAFKSGALAGDVRESVLASLTAGPLKETDKEPALIVETLGGRTLIFDHAASLVRDRAATSRGNPVGASSAPVLEDLDGDREREIIAVDGAHLYAFHANGELLAGYPVELSESTGPPAIGDVDGDGLADIALAGRTRAFLLHGASGASFERWPVTLLSSEATLPRGTEALRLPAVALGDVDKDGRLDVVIALRGTRVVAFNQGGGTLVIAQAAGLGEEFALGDLNGDGVLDAMRAGDRNMESFSLADGVPLSTAPFAVTGRALGGAAIADIDDDGRPEAIFDGGDGTLEAANSDGVRPRLWPKLIGDSLIGTPELGDLDGDGLLEVVAVTRGGRVFAWRTRAVKNGAAWLGARHDSRATGNVETPLAVLTEISVGAGCRCSVEFGSGSGSGSGSDVLSFAVLGLFLGARAAVHRTRRGASAQRR